MKYLGIDYGTKNIGIAVSDDNGSVAFPHSTVAAGRDAVSKIAALAKEVGAGAAVLGESRNFAGEKNEVMEDIEQFKQDLGELAGVVAHRLFGVDHVAQHHADAQIGHVLAVKGCGLHALDGEGFEPRGRRAVVVDEDGIDPDVRRMPLERAQVVGGAEPRGLARLAHGVHDVQDERLALVDRGDDVWREERRDDAGVEAPGADDHDVRRTDGLDDVGRRFARLMAAEIWRSLRDW